MSQTNFVTNNGSPETDLRARLASDRHRPQYHFLPPANWLNDPNGAIQWQGQYHLFYQYNPKGPFWGDIHWGHAVSSDLIYWRDLPIALTPSPDSADADGCWSGYAVNDNGVPTLIYTGVQNNYQQRPCLATSSDQLVTWEKYADNPIIVAPPTDLDITGFRDHCLWHEDGLWYQIIGAGLKSGGGAALLYTSPDLRHWQYEHPLISGDFDLKDEVWECPDFFALDGQHFLLISSVAQSRVLCQRGTYTDRRFNLQSVSPLDLGSYLYAPQSFCDDNGRRILWGWLREGRSENAQRAAGWSGVMSLPLVLSKQPDGNLGVTFAPELEQLRGAYYERTGLELTDSDFERFGGMVGDCLEIIAEFEPGDAASFGLVVLASPDEAEQTRIIYDAQNQQMAVDRDRASLDPTTHRHLQSGPCALTTEGRVRLHIFLDRSVIEISANDGTYLSSRVYPTRYDSRDLGWFATGGRARLVNLQVWQLAAIWDEGRPLAV